MNAGLLVFLVILIGPIVFLFISIYLQEEVTTNYQTGYFGFSHKIPLTIQGRRKTDGVWQPLAEVKNDYKHTEVGKRRFHDEVTFVTESDWVKAAITRAESLLASLDDTIFQDIRIIYNYAIWQNGRWI